MAKKSILKRGFKANAERIAKQYREELGIHACAPLNAFELAKHLSIPIYGFSNFVSDDNHLKLLAGSNGSSSQISALTMVTKAGNRIIIHNKYHSDARQQSNIMHELSHIICDHKLEQKDYGFEIPFGMREFNEEQEEEAKCLGATLQLSSPCLLWAKKRNMAYYEVGSYFNASEEMVRYRMNITGIARRR